MNAIVILRLTQADLVLLNRAIGEFSLPYKDMGPLNDLVARLNEQIQAQTTPRPMPEPPKARDMPLLPNGQTDETVVNGALSRAG